MGMIFKFKHLCGQIIIFGIFRFVLRKTSSILLIALLTPPLVLTPALAQGVAQISGTVTSTRTERIEGAIITLHDPKRGFTKTVLSKADGRYHFSNIHIGEYTMSVSYQGQKCDTGPLLAQSGSMRGINFVISFVPQETAEDRNIESKNPEGTRVEDTIIVTTHKPLACDWN